MATQKRRRETVKESDDQLLPANGIDGVDGSSNKKTKILHENDDDDTKMENAPEQTEFKHKSKPSGLMKSFKMHDLDFKFEDPYSYLPGFGAMLQSEALPHALPIGQNNPQKCPYGLLAEQLSGTSFTTPRVSNMRSWLYRIHPTCMNSPFTKIDKGLLRSHFGPQDDTVGIPDQLRWRPFELPSADSKVDFVQGLATVSGAGGPELKTGMAIHIYACNVSMKDKAFVNSDGDFLIVPQLGVLTIQTEFGWLTVPPTFICVIPRGIKFSVNINETSRGYIAEVYNGHFTLPDLGPIGSNGLANPRDFEHPVACFERKNSRYQVVQKYLGDLFQYELPFSPYDVVAWHGNYAPYRYNLAHFVVVNSVSVDHMDPSIFTVLTCPTVEKGVACCDFVIFPPRWAVQEKTFRPPYYHRNCMTEFMGNIVGNYDAKPTGFAPGAGSLHSCMVGHGPDANSLKHHSEMPLNPTYMKDSLAFMFESTYLFRVTDWALSTRVNLDKDYYKCWQDIPDSFDPNWTPQQAQSSSSSSSST